jgi:hypothetical protein
LTSPAATGRVGTPLVLAFGDPGPLPFLGHFRAEARGPQSVLRVAGRVAGAADAVEACAIAAQVEAGVRGLVHDLDRPDDRLALLRSLWAVVAGVEERLPASLSADFAVLVMAADARGVSVTGVGLAGCWFEADRQPPRPLVPARHPLLGPLGVPDIRPGAMTLNAVPTALYAELRHPVAPPSGLPDSDLRAACGARR